MAGRGRVEKRPRALRDLADIAVHLAVESGSEAVAFRFLDAAEITFERLAALPTLGVAREYDDPELRSMRMWRVRGFSSYLIFYRPLRDGVEIIRVLHAMRDIEGLFGGRKPPRGDSHV